VLARHQTLGLQLGEHLSKRQRSDAILDGQPYM
jgi:hypothetical protein